MRRVTMIVTLLFLFPVSADSENVSFDNRMLWVVRDAMVSEKSIDGVLQFAEENDFNHLIVQVRGRGDALYNSSFVPRSIRIKNTEFDPLDYIIKRTRGTQIQIHAWVNMYYLWSASSFPKQENHLLHVQPDWLDNDKPSRINVEQTLDAIRNNRYNDEGLFLAPTHPEVTPYLISMVTEIVSKYDVDGIHLDYIRYYNEKFGLNPDGLSQYQFLENGGELPLLSSSQIIKDPDWGNYRRKAITQLVKGISQVIKEKNDQCVLSAAVKPNIYSARNEFGQEWDVWLLAGYLDWAIPMNYLPELDIFSTNIQIMDDNLPKKHRSKIVMGLATYNQDPTQVNEKIQFTKKSGFNSICLFSYNVFRDSSGYFDKIRNQLVP